MADTIDIAVASTWTEFPAADEFLFQNTSHHVIRVVVSDTEPSGVDGHRLEPRESISRIATGKHWHRCPIEAASAAFTVVTAAS